MNQKTCKRFKLMPPPLPRSPRPRTGPPPPTRPWLSDLLVWTLDASHHGPMPPPRRPAGLPLTDAIETFTSRVLRSGNDAEALGTHSTSVADVRKKYKEAATMLHPDKQHGRDEAARRRTATAWQRVSAAYGRVMAALGAGVPDG